MTIFRDARSQDDQQLTELIATPLPGSLSLSFSRDPSYLKACRECGPQRSVLTAADGDQILATCSYFKRDYWVGGQPKSLWTVSDMRARGWAAGLSLTGRGWPELKRRLGPEPKLISLVTDNDRAARLFSKSRPGWPNLRELLKLQTHILPLAGVKLKNPGPRIRQLDQVELLDFLGHVGPSRDLSPVVKGRDLGAVLPPTRDFWGVFEDQRLVACAGLWNPQAYRQVRVHSYQGWYDKAYRASQGLGLSALPSPGQALSISYLVLLCGQAQAATELLSFLRGRARADGASFLVFGSGGQGPQFKKPHWPSFTYRSALFQLSWPEDMPLSLGEDASFEVAWL